MTVPVAIGFHLASCSALPSLRERRGIYLETPDPVAAQPLTSTALP